ncbi:Ssz1p [Sugiyamaella lignohabitans]|uniref:Ssz1p n=1 Tax=Sugiyamaella lignohabitans TaxID=796027 RepID=A0A167EAN2_9ASCO|nr:Ssz1p [Sugiyamaella lignohabitans]ANB13842.1 Ssz1p [Sugiyamaella lignohabitans]
MSGPTVIGLAFGNTTSSIAIEKDGKVELIANQDGDRAIASVISYVGSDEYHGAQAKAQLIRNAKNTVAYFRDFLGVSFDNVDPTNSHASAHPVELNGQASFSLKTEDDDEETGEVKPAKLLSVHEIAVRHLDRLRESAADYIGKAIDGAVIAVPTDYSEERRQAIVAAAKDANLKILQVINEPTAALLAHVSANGDSTDKKYAVIDIGGTRSDGAIIASRGGIFTILTTLHNYELGGKNLDEALVDFFAKDFEKQHKVDPKTEARAVAKLLAESESTKKTLSNTSSANFAVESVAQGYDYSLSINRLRFEVAARSVFTKITQFVEELIKKANLDVLDIDEVLLVGGTSAVPKVATSIASLFDESVTKISAPAFDTKAIQPDELISRGAAIQASLVAGYDDEEINESLQAVVTVAPHTTKSIGVKVGDNEYVEVIASETALPIRKTVTLSTPADATAVLVGVYEGASEIVVTKVEKEEKKDDAEDDESDWSEDEEDEEIRTKVLKPAAKIAELGLQNIPAGSKVEVVLNITRELKLQIAARAGSVAVRGETAVAHVA